MEEKCRYTKILNFPFIIEPLILYVVGIVKLIENFSGRKTEQYFCFALNSKYYHYTLFLCSIFLLNDEMTELVIKIPVHTAECGH